MANTTLQYIAVDFQSVKNALIQRIRARWSLSVSDLTSNSLAIVLIDIMAWALSTYAFIVNRIAGEMYIPTMTLRESAVRIGALVNYQLRGATASTISCQATIPNDSPARILD